MRYAGGIAASLLLCVLAGCGESQSDGAVPSDAATFDSAIDVVEIDAPIDAAPEFEPLFDGQSLDGFELVGVLPQDLSIVDGELRCRCTTNGYLYKNESYRNFVLELEFRFERPPGLAPGDDLAFNGNSGYFVYLEPPHQVWPRCLEVQGMYQEVGDIFGLPGLTDGHDAPDLTAREAARRPVGEWNALRITSQAGALTVEQNGLVVNQSTPGELSQGLIALESEGAEIHWRNVRIKRLPD